MVAVLAVVAFAAAGPAPPRSPRPASCHEYTEAATACLQHSTMIWN